MIPFPPPPPMSEEDFQALGWFSLLLALETGQVFKVYEVVRCGDEQGVVLVPPAYSGPAIFVKKTKLIAQYRLLTKKRA